MGKGIAHCVQQNSWKGGPRLCKNHGIQVSKQLCSVVAASVPAPRFRPWVPTLASLNDKWWAVRKISLFLPMLVLVGLLSQQQSRTDVRCYDWKVASYMLWWCTNSGIIPPQLHAAYLPYPSPNIFFLIMWWYFLRTFSGCCHLIFSIPYGRFLHTWLFLSYSLNGRSLVALFLLCLPHEF